MRAYNPKDEGASLIVSKESVLITSTIETKQNRDVMTADIPNAFVQTDIEKRDQNKKIMKIRGQLVNILIELETSTCAKYMIKQNISPILYVKLIKALYAMLTSALLFYKKIKIDVEKLALKLTHMIHV